MFIEGGIAMLKRRFTMLIALTAVLAACQPQAQQAPKKLAFKSIDITGAEYAKDFALPDTDGKHRTMADFKGKVVIVFFGFAQCPDVCPVTLAEIAEVKKQLGPDGAKVQGVFITIDPERDTPPVLAAYVKSFGDDFVALRGTDEQTQATAKAFKVFYAKVPGQTTGGYNIDHTAGAFVFDPQGRVRLFSRYGAGTPALVHDVKLLLQ
jgi:protein SCO1/2